MSDPISNSESSPLRPELVAEGPSTVAVLDALGFKGIWEKYRPAAVIQRLGEVNTAATEAVATWEKEFSKLPSDVIQLEPRLAQLSDSLVVSAIGHKGRAYDEKFPTLPFQAMAFGYTLYLVSVVVSHILAVAGHAKPLPDGPPPLIFRGAIACGSLWHSGSSYFVGPAIDQAAADEGIADGAFVVFCESAMAVMKQVADELPIPIVREYPVPLRLGGYRVSHVVDPFGLIPAMARVFRPERTNDYALYAIAQLYEAMRDFMNTERAGRKWEHTRPFLNAAGSQTFRALHPGKKLPAGTLNMESFVRDLRSAIEAAGESEPT